MQPYLQKPAIQILHSMAKQGLIHRRRTCMACFTHPMQLHSVPDTENKYIWKCSFCFYQCAINRSTILCQVNVQAFDTALTLWMVNCKTLNAARIINEKSKNIT